MTDHILSEPEAKALLARFGVAIPKGAVAVTPAGLSEAASALTPPFAVKIVDASGSHKSDVGGVTLGLADPGAVEAAARRMPPSADGYLVEEMAAAGVEIALGGFRHPRFGPVLMAGMGGVMVELLDDVAFRVCPIDRVEAEKMLAELRGARLLDGFRGRPSANRDALIDVMLAIGGAGGLLMDAHANVAEIDVNPLIVSANGAVAVDARACLAPTSEPPSRLPAPDLERLFNPNAVAVAGASATQVSAGNQYIRALQAFGYQGAIYPVHPTAPEIEGRRAYRSFAALPEPVDYAYVAVGAQAAASLVAGAGGKVRFAQAMASGFDETSRAALASAARDGGARVLGPNCLGVHAPAAGFTFMAGAEGEPGGVAVLSQSGGLSMDLLRRGARRGIAYRGLVTMGDCADLGPADLLPWLVDDPETSVIGLYLEDAPAGRDLFQALKRARGVKPVVLLVGGRTGAGARAAMSHTGALASDGRLWAGIARQVGAALTETLDDFLAALLACQTLRPRYGRPTQRAVLFGNGGGASVLATDAFGRLGLEVGPLPETAAERLAAFDLPAGASAANPIDVPGNALQREGGRLGVKLVEAALADGDWDAFVLHMNVPVLLTYAHVDILGPLIDAALKIAGAGAGGHVVLVLRSDGEPEVEAKKQAYRERALKAGAAVFDELPEAARALAALAEIEDGVSAS